MAEGASLWQRLRPQRGAMVGLWVLALLMVFVLLGPWLWRIAPTHIDIRARNQGLSWAHPLGTDQLGRDMMARLMAGGRISLAVAMAVMPITLGLGGLVGLLAGYFRRLDGVLMRLTELFLALPLLPLLLLMVTLFREPLARHLGPPGGSFVLIVLAIGLTSWMAVARILRGEVLALKERGFIEAARAIGTRPGAMLWRHVLPNVASPVVVAATLGMATAITTESALSFLGLGFPPDYPTLGRLLHDAMDQMQQYPLRALLPGLMIAVTVLAVNAVGEGLREALDPRSGSR
jgi:peptide/nickel transport system permease protein